MIMKDRQWDEGEAREEKERVTDALQTGGRVSVDCSSLDLHAEGGGNVGANRRHQAQLRRHSSGQWAECGNTDYAPLHPTCLEAGLPQQTAAMCDPRHMVFQRPSGAAFDGRPEAKRRWRAGVHAPPSAPCCPAMPSDGAAQPMAPWAQCPGARARRLITV
jgi:hypothetical protein